MSEKIKPSFTDIIRKPFFAWYLGVAALSWIFAFTITEQESAQLLTIVTKLAAIGITGYFVYQLKKQWQWVLLGLVPLVPLGYWAVLGIMYWLYSKEK